MSRPALVLSTAISNTLRPPYELEQEQIPLVIQMIHSGEDEGSIIRSILGDDVQISIDAIDEVCRAFARHREICQLKLTSTRSIG